MLVDGQRRLVAVCRVIVPANYAGPLLGLRLRLSLSQQQLAGQVGAASKAVTYQWRAASESPRPCSGCESKNCDATRGLRLKLTCRNMTSRAAAFRTSVS